jgi:hypothetical protein
VDVFFSKTPDLLIDATAEDCDGAIDDCFQSKIADGLFLDSCLCSDTVSNTVDYKYEKINNNAFGIIKKQVGENKIKKTKTDYKYVEPDFDIIESALNKISLDSYDDWFKITCAIKNLYLGLCYTSANKLYDIYDKYCSKYDNYNKVTNKNTFNSVKPLISINYLFHVADIKYYLNPIYNYQAFMFNINNHKNIITDKSKNINIDIDKLIKYKLICLKSPTGTGKTKFLKTILDKLETDNVLSIVSRGSLS